MSIEVRGHLQEGGLVSTTAGQRHITSFLTLQRRCLGQTKENRLTLKKKSVKLGLVGFIDLLGYTNRVRSLHTFDDVRQLDQDLNRIQDWFDYQPTDNLTKSVQKISGKKVLAFSDCVIVFLPVNSSLTKSQGDFDVFLNELFILALSQGRCAINEIIVRGGIDYEIWCKRKDRLISPAFVAAYEAERGAVVPMIAVTEELYEHLSNHPHRQFYAASYDPLPKLIRKFDNFPDGKNRRFIDYLPVFLEALDGKLTGEEKEVYFSVDSETRATMRDKAFWRDCHRWALCHANFIRKQLAATNDRNIREKYSWLAWYHNDALDRYYNGTVSEDLLIEDT